MRRERCQCYDDPERVHAWAGGKVHPSGLTDEPPFIQLYWPREQHVCRVRVGEWVVRNVRDGRVRVGALAGAYAVLAAFAAPPLQPADPGPEPLDP